jgi:nitrite reductase/ring-hydroxylating ferredoxin subunit/uncharacterized membrane protein
VSIFGPVHRQLTPLEPAVRAIESAKFIDPVAKAAASSARAILSGPLKDVLSGTWLGHAVHPSLTDLVIGSFTSASLLDLLGGDELARASERLIGVGIAAYAPTALTGLSDWVDSEYDNDAVRRAGAVHAVTNATALSLYTASLIARRRGDRRRGMALGGLGAAVLSMGGYLGGYLTLSKGVGVDQTTFDPGPTEWTLAEDSSLLQTGRPTRVVVQDTPVLLMRDGEQIFAIHDRCSHRGCSLCAGSFEGEEIVCACHGSRFDRRNGAVLGGPATAPQPAFQVRDREGSIEIRRISPASS